MGRNLPRSRLILCPPRPNSRTSRSRRSAAAFRAGARLTDIAADYDVNRKTIRRRLDALALAEAERAQRTAAKRAEQKRMKRLDRLYRNPAARPEHARPRTAASPQPPSGALEYGRPVATAGRRHAAGGRILPLNPSLTYADWLDERDARLPAPRDRRVRLVTESGKTIASTSESNVERMSAALEPRHGPLTVVPA